jgi:transcriptional regulator with XRE-family HTH domain
MERVEQVRERQREWGWTDERMSIALGVSREWYNKWANGKVNSPTLDASADIFLLTNFSMPKSNLKKGESWRERFGNLLERISLRGLTARITRQQ